MKTNVESLKKTISDLKKEFKKTASASENPKADKGLKTLRKKLKRSQRKLRLVRPPLSKEGKKEEAAEEKKAEVKG